MAAPKNKDIGGYVEWAPGRWAKPEDVPAAKAAYEKDLADDKARRQANGTNYQTGADWLLNIGDEAQAAGVNAANEAKQLAKDAAPPDTFEATEKALARARTQQMMQATNGRAGSVLGIGTDSFTATRRTMSRQNARINISPNAFDLAGTLRKNRAFGKVRTMMFGAKTLGFGLAGARLT